MPNIDQYGILKLKTLRSKQHKILVAELKQARLGAGLTQAELANRMGTQQSFVAKVEGGERRLDVVEFINWIKQSSGEEYGIEVLRKLF